MARSFGSLDNAKYDPGDGSIALQLCKGVGGMEVAFLNSISLH